MQVNMAKNVIIRNRWILTVYHITSSFKTNYAVELQFAPRIQIRQTRMSKVTAEMDKYFNCPSLTRSFLAHVLSPGFGHTNQKHKFAPVMPNSDNKCKILYQSEQRIAKKLYYLKKENMSKSIMTE